MNRKLLKTHGIILMCMGIVMTVQTLIGGTVGVGMMKFIHQNLFAIIGLFEAYLLAALLGTFLIFASKNAGNSYWHLCAALIHVILASTNIIFWKAYTIGNIQLAGWIATSAHVIFIILELYAFRKNRVGVNE